MRHLTSCVTSNPLNEQTLITLFMQGLTDGPVKTNLFRLENDNLEEAIKLAEQEDFNVQQDHVNSNFYRLPRRQENGGPEPSITLRVKALRYQLREMQRCNRCQKTGHYAYQCSASNAVTRTAGNSTLQAAKKGPRRGSTLLRKCNILTDRKNVQRQ